MGQAADDMINGLTCSYCGVWMKKSYGYPVVCEDCWEKGDELPKGKSL